MSTRYHPRTTGFLLFCLLSLVLFWKSISALATLSMQDDRYSYAILMPLIGVGLVLADRQRIFPHSRYSLAWGIPLAIAGAILYIAARLLDAGLSFEMLPITLVWMAGYLLFYGPEAVRSSVFPLAAVLLTAPLPQNFMHMAEVGLQNGSAEVSHVLFKLTGIPVFRHGLVFSLPGLNIEVAEQCSGIRSTTALLITAAMASHLFLRSNWSKLALILLTIPIAIFKNAVRITTLSWMGVYVSRDVLEGPLHRMGGLPFTLVAIALLVPLLLLLRWLENRQGSAVAAAELQPR